MPDETGKPVNAGIIGEIERSAIIIANYDPAWPHRFVHEEARIQRSLGPTALSVEHVGSTAVPGLAAKPIIDILLVVGDSSNEDTYLPHLERAGYILRVREPDFEEHRMVRTPEKDVHVHIYSPDSREGERLILMRDHLRNDGADRELYASTKRELVLRDWPSMQHYANAKTEVIQEILARACRSAKSQ